MNLMAFVKAWSPWSCKNQKASDFKRMHDLALKKLHMLIVVVHVQTANALVAFVAHYKVQVQQIVLSQQRETASSGHWCGQHLCELLFRPQKSRAQPSSRLFLSFVLFIGFFFLAPNTNNSDENLPSMFQFTYTVAYIGLCEFIVSSYISFQRHSIGVAA